jgi:RecA/RadA recombinase
LSFNFKQFAKANLGETSEEIPTTTFIDTGSYTLNGLLSADIFGGIPSNRITAFAGPSGTGKSYLTFSVMKSFLEGDDNAGTFLYDTEFALDAAGISKRGLDPDRILLKYPDSIEDFKTQCVNILDKFAKMKDAEKPNLMFVLDSLGNLGSAKENNDAVEGNHVNDMTRQKQIRSAFRILTLRLGKLGFPMVVTNHTYQNIGGYGDPTVIAGGGGLIYAATTIVSLSKAKDTEGSGAEKEVVGNVLTAKTFKSRCSKENQQVKLKLNYTTGLDRYYGLADLAIEGGIWQKGARHIEVSDGSKHFESKIYDDAPRFFDKATLTKINEFVKVKYGLGNGEEKSDMPADGADVEA